MTTKQVPIASITPIQLRAATDPRYVEELAVVLIDPSHRNEIPPIECLTDGVQTWCWDGVHRLLAAKEAGLEKVRAHVEPGTHNDAIYAAAGANVRHGLRRTNADKRKCVAAVLAVDSSKSDRAIAEICGVTHPTVSDVRREVENFTTQATHPAAGGESPPAEQEAPAADFSTTDDQASDGGTDAEEACDGQEPDDTDDTDGQQEHGTDATSFEEFYGHFERLRRVWAELSDAAFLNWADMAIQQMRGET